MTAAVAYLNFERNDRDLLVRSNLFNHELTNSIVVAVDPRMNNTGGQKVAR